MTLTRRVAHLIFAAGILALAGCKSAGVPPNQPLQKDTLEEYAIVIVGLDSTMQSTWGPWTYSENSQTVNGVLGGALLRTLNVNKPGQGFVAMRVSPPLKNERFGPMEFVPADGEYRYKYCKGRKVPTVQVRAGDVIYAGSLLVGSNGPNLSLRFVYDMVGARRFVAANYPALADRLQAQPFEFFEVRTQPTCR
ncbi:hypothetical protein PTE30175_03727 [Pandoraea terrae]|uniref:DUF4823 domain-containing protein n=1 Tax=Pandoraea terrae TaxID=1537710 RepID=A0A5E4XE32_9BURK|nr:hypothetical protein [Pandoraea terrae]VVE34452.1 hypothetical protein PTE30175_03727 [Pandoraea terrae]